MVTFARWCADIDAIHGAGVGSFEGYAPQDKQPIDLAIWGGPRQAPLSRWRCYANGLTWLLWRRWRPGRPVWPGNGNEPLARLLIRRGATYHLTVASAFNDLAAVRSMLDAARSRRSSSAPTIVANSPRPPNSAVSTSSPPAGTRRGPDVARRRLVRARRRLARRGGRGDRRWSTAAETSRRPQRFRQRQRQRRLCRERGESEDCLRRMAVSSIRTTWSGRAKRRGHWDRDRTTRHGARRVRGCVHGRRHLRPAQADAPTTRRRCKTVAGGRVPLLSAERPDMLAGCSRGGLNPNYPTVDGVTLLHALCHKAVAGGRGPSDRMCGDYLGVRRNPSPKDAQADARNVGDEARAHGHRRFPESPRRT